MLSHKGLFVTFEGGEGAGKSTLVARLLDALRKEGHEVLLTREPGGTSFGEQLRELLLHHKCKLSLRAELLVFLASRAQHIDEVIKPALARSEIVLCDRFNDSTIAYQGIARGLGIDYVEECIKLATDNFQPDLTLYVDLDPTIGLKRTAGRRQKTKTQIDRLEREGLEFHQKVREGFQLLAKKYPERITTLDGTLEPDTLFHEAHTLLQRRLT